MVFLLVYCLVNTAGATLKNMALVYYCNYVLGTYSDGITLMLINVIGGIPMGIGIFAVWPLAKKFGKKNVTVGGCLLIALGSAVCWMAPTNMVIVLVGVGLSVLNACLNASGYIPPINTGSIEEV